MDPLNEVNEKGQCEKIHSSPLYLEYPILKQEFPFHINEYNGGKMFFKSISYSMQIYISTIIENATK